MSERITEKGRVPESSLAVTLHLLKRVTYGVLGLGVFALIYVGASRVTFDDPVSKNIPEGAYQTIDGHKITQYDPRSLLIKMDREGQASDPPIILEAIRTQKLLDNIQAKCTRTSPLPNSSVVRLYVDTASPDCLRILIGATPAENPGS